MTGTFTSKGKRIAFAVAFGLCTLSLLFAVTLFAQRSDKATVITFNSPVEIPGSNPQVLPAGTYMFKLVDSKSTPHIVQVSNKEESKVYSTIMAMPAHRDASTRETVITFEERGAGQPQAVQTWFYPNDINGEEFVYSGNPPRQVAAVTPAAPVTTTTTTTQNTTVAETPARVPEPAPAPRVEATPAPTPPPVTAQTTPTPAPAPAPEPAREAAAPPPQAPQPAAPEATPTPNPAPAANAQPEALPHTASNLPILLLAGVLSLGAGFTLRRLSRG
jgi:hypothetical protein